MRQNDPIWLYNIQFVVINELLNFIYV